MTKSALPAHKNTVSHATGATLIEYAVLVALIIIVALAAISLVGRKVSQQFSTVASSI